MTDQTHAPLIIMTCHMKDGEPSVAVTQISGAQPPEDVVDGWYFSAWYSSYTGSWTGLAKREPFVDGRPLYEPGEVWFEPGTTREEALSKIKRSVLS